MLGRLPIMLATLSSSLSRSALLAILGALPPVDFPAVCLVRAMLLLLLLLLCVVLVALAGWAWSHSPHAHIDLLTNLVGGKSCLLRTRTALLCSSVDRCASLLRCGKTTRQSPWTRQLLAQKLEQLLITLK